MCHRHKHNIITQLKPVSVIFTTASNITGVLKVVKKLEFSSSSMCKYPSEISIMINTFAC